MIQELFTQNSIFHFLIPLILALWLRKYKISTQKSLIIVMSVVILFEIFEHKLDLSVILLPKLTLIIGQTKELLSNMYMDILLGFIGWWIGQIK